MVMSWNYLNTKGEVERWLIKITQISHWAPLVFFPVFFDVRGLRPDMLFSLFFFFFSMNVCNYSITSQSKRKPGENEACLVQFPCIKYNWKSIGKRTIENTLSVYANYIGPPVMTDGIRLGPVFPSRLSDQMTGTRKHVHAIEILRS